MRFDDFARAHGLILDRVIAGRWVRVPTVDHPKKRNGAYKYLGDIGFVQNHATQVDVSEWRPDADAPKLDPARIAAQAADFQRRLIAGQERAAKRAAELIADAAQEEHGYLSYKGFSGARGLVGPSGALIVPMRDWRTNALSGVQRIRWLADERRYEKKMLPGMKAKGAILRIGSPQAGRTWLVEGYATGLSVKAALDSLRLRDAVVVCFSDGNLTHVAKQLSGPRFVFADNDASGAGLRAAEATGLRYCMSPTTGHDANDMHRSEGVYKVASLMVQTAAGSPMG